MYTYNGVVISSFQIYERLKQEKRRTKPCPFCNARNIQPAVLGVMFFMECRGCGATGPCVADYHDPLGLNATSWIYALKVCHDRWNGWGKIISKTTPIQSANSINVSSVAKLFIKEELVPSAVDILTVSNQFYESGS